METQAIVHGGRLVVKTISATAGNVATALGPGTSNLRWMIMGWRISLATDATVATRTIRVQKREVGGNPIAAIVAGADRAASGTTTFATTSIRTNIGNAQWPVDGAMVNIVPETYQLTRGMDIYISINNGVVGDSYSGFVEVLEFAG